MTLAAELTPSHQQPHPMLPASNTVLPDTKSRETSRFAFFAGDNITISEKYAIPGRFMGGVELDMFLTLKETGKELYARPDLYNTGGVMYRCAITQLKTFYLPVNPAMVAPDDREADGGKYISGYTKENGRYNEKTGRFEDVKVGGLLYRPFYPGDEIHSLTRPSEGLRPGGIVEIQALNGKGWQDQIAAQLHYFPNWEAIQTDVEHFPATLKELRAQIVERMNAADSPVMKSIGRDMLRSCDEFRLWGLRYLKAWRQIVKFADSSIDSPISGYNELCEMLFGMLEVNREDTLGQAGNVSEIASQIGTAIAAAISQGFSPQQAIQQVSAANVPPPLQDPLDGLVAADSTPGIVIPTEDQQPNAEVIAGLTGGPVPNVPTTATTGTAPLSVTEPSTTDGGEPIAVSQKVIYVADGREGLVTWKGPNNKIKLAFETGETITIDKSEVMAKR